MSTTVPTDLVRLPRATFLLTNILALQSDLLHPRIPQAASTGSNAPTASTTTPPTISVPFSQTSATQWTVPQVIAWLQSKGFDAEIQRGFQENDITGDVLIELDGSALKDELGVTAFGKRMRLLKQIGVLKRDEEKSKEPSRRNSSLLQSESTHKPDITKAKHVFDQPQSQPRPTTTIKTDTRTDSSVAGSTPISSFPPSPSLKREKWEKEKDVKSVTNSEGATLSEHARKHSINASSVTGGARD
ncbi:unnamed protein product [Rhizoctonia solani]|uniref:SAM domain-containing protein n=1 Tax=Rhizoctonia solani TaxID=456999 RepID=A0A8H3BEP0_9AGAM|nr:unnamed protein product [Rhizoctonia solani]